MLASNVVMKSWDDLGAPLALKKQDVEILAAYPVARNQLPQLHLLLFHPHMHRLSAFC